MLTLDNTHPRWSGARSGSTTSAICAGQVSSCGPCRYVRSAGRRWSRSGKAGVAAARRTRRSQSVAAGWRINRGRGEVLQREDYLAKAVTAASSATTSSGVGQHVVGLGYAVMAVGCSSLQGRHSDGLCRRRSDGSREHRLPRRLHSRGHDGRWHRLAVGVEVQGSRATVRWERQQRPWWLLPRCWPRPECRRCAHLRRGLLVEPHPAASHGRDQCRLRSLVRRRLPGRVSIRSPRDAVLLGSRHLQREVYLAMPTTWPSSSCGPPTVRLGTATE